MVADRLRQCLALDFIHQHARQRVAVELEMPTAFWSWSHIYIRCDIASAMCQTSSRLRIESADLSDHVRDVVIADPAQLRAKTKCYILQAA